MIKHKQKKSILSLIILLGSLAIVAQLVWAAFSSDPLNVSQTLVDAGYPAIAVSADGQNIGLVWADRYNGGHAAEGPIFLKTVSNSTTIDARYTVDNSNSITDQSLTPDIAADPNPQTNMHVVWANKKTANYTIYYALCSTISDICSDTNHEIITTTTAAKTFDPRVATGYNSGTVVHAVWQWVENNPTKKSSIYYSARTSAEADWATNRQLVSIDTGDLDSQPAIAVSQATSGATYVHVVWASDTDADDVDNEQIVYRRGEVVAGIVATWSATQSFKLNDTIASGLVADDPARPAITAIGDVVMIAWDEKVASGDIGSYDVNKDKYYPGYAYSENVGASFDMEIIDRIDGSPNKPLLSDPDGSSTAGFTGSHAPGLKLSVSAQLTSTADITAVISVVWHETTDTTTRYHDIYSHKFWVGDCGDCYTWGPGTNETGGKKLTGNHLYYSMSPDVASTITDTYSFYMEGKEDVEWQIDTPGTSVFDAIYKGTVVFTDTTTGNPSDGGVYLPIVVKNK